VSGKLPLDFASNYKYYLMIDDKEALYLLGAAGAAGWAV
jgi:hypothetical protein